MLLQKNKYRMTKKNYFYEKGDRKRKPITAAQQSNKIKIKLVIKNIGSSVCGTAIFTLISS